MLNICNITIKQGIKVLIFNALFLNLLQASNTNLNKYINKNKIYNDTYWSKLLHYKNGISEIDSDNFFVSKNGKNDLKKSY